jgi:hypothetical protein
VTLQAVIGGLLRFLASLAFPLTDAFRTSSIAVEPMIAAAGFIAILAGAIRVRSRPLWMAVTLFALSLAPVLPVLGGPTSLYHSRHYYLPSVALSLVIGLLTARFAAGVPRSARQPLAVLTIAYFLVCLQLNIHHWRRNSRLASEITEVVAVRASKVPSGTTLYVTGYPDMEGPFFPFHGNTIQQAVHLFHSDTAGVKVQCVGPRFCAGGPPPAEAPVLEVAVRDWRATEASYRAP